MDLKTPSASSHKNVSTILKQLESDGIIGISVDCVIFGFDDNELKVLLIKSDLEGFEDKFSLLGDLVHNHEDLDQAAYRILRERTGMDDVYLEQVRSFGQIGRHPAGRVVTIAYASLVNIEHHKLKILANEVHWHRVTTISEMAFDHKTILMVCYEWLQRRIQEHPLGFSLLPKQFSLRELQNLYEAILDVKLDRRNFRKKFFSMDLLEDTGELETDVPHRPGKLYRFNYDKYKKKERKKWFGIDF
ncbi:MAG: NUDIX domain-containing protein [Bacteroidota bacterium]|nr:NUDIX domain-containing protein [Bacteroidota bacterium]MDP4214969.1 NUDIX domain-containing protein [Bacteroidota bacterium]MDP4244648.1 NUDIX domain-containing protein [Bacteroidota bacterium]MDP4254995.1 NUDIX domain-containing protein [Bacteroidota bacterium]MDP4258656.1 NUDIX domain-containing protein [Bacteroidota bacterium]